VFDGPGFPLSIFFLSFAAIFVLRGPFGKALAERLSGRVVPHDDGAVLELREEVEELRRQLGEVQERLDFAERVLARPSHDKLVGPGDPPR
jgi:hypothetical protein